MTKNKDYRLKPYRRRNRTYKQAVALGARRSRRSRIIASQNARDRRARITQDTFHIILTTHGYYEEVPDDNGCSAGPSGIYHDLSGPILRSREGSSFYQHMSALLGTWRDGPRLSVRDVDPLTTIPSSSSSLSSVSTTRFEYVTLSTLAAARQVWLSNPLLQFRKSGLGVLNDALPKKPGGSSLTGGGLHEECLVRQSTLFDSLQNSSAGSSFYSEHRIESDRSGFHDHSMLYSPSVVVFKDDAGHCIPPFTIGVVSCVPVNAGTVRVRFNISDEEKYSGIRRVMEDRMGRILRLFEERGDQILILNAFGVGQFGNSPDMVGEIWADLLGTKDAKFYGVFEKVIFAVPGKYLRALENSFAAKVLEAELLAATLDE